MTFCQIIYQHTKISSNGFSYLKDAAHISAALNLRLENIIQTFCDHDIFSNESITPPPPLYVQYVELTILFHDKGRIRCQSQLEEGGHGVEKDKKQ